MNYTKPPLNFRDQASRIISRGLIADIDELEKFLSKVNYYRFTGYLFPFRDGGETYFPGTTFEKIRSIYNFDTRFRWLTFTSIEILDIAILRTQLVEKFTLRYGPFCYVDKGNFFNIWESQHDKIIKDINFNVSRSSEIFVEKYQSKYSNEDFLPFWMVAELSSFGLLSRIFKYAPNDVRHPIANQFSILPEFLESWLHMLTSIRNICAHHSRYWNRILPVTPSIPPKKYLTTFYEPNQIPRRQVFIVLVIIKYLLDRIEPDNTFIEQFQTLLSEHPEVPIEKMGIPENWEEYPIFGL